MSVQQSCWITCDKCGAESEHYDTHVKAELNALLEGWARGKFDVRPQHYCPRCKPQSTTGTTAQEAR